MTPFLLDTGVIVALLDKSEQFHKACVAAISDLKAPLVTCEAVIAEACYLVRNMAGAKEAVLENVATGVFQVPFRLVESVGEVRRILKKYADREVDLADACLVHLATELKTAEILTLDSDFLVYRWGVNKHFRNLVELA